MKKALSILLVVTLICSIFALPVMAESSEEIAKLNKAEYTPLPLDSGANCHIFEPQGQTVEGISDPTSTLYTSGTRDYIYDYMQTYWYDNTVTMGVDGEDSTTYTWDHFPIYYRTSTSFSGSYLTLDANSSWTVPFLEADGETVKQLPYKIDTSKDIIKLVGPWSSTYQKLTEKAKTAYSAKNTALRSATIDINDTFKNIYILASKGRYQTASTAPENFTADVYYEGEETPVNVKIGIKKANISTTDAELASITSIFNKITNSTTNTSSWQYPSLGYAADSTWYSYEIPCNVSKKVEKITFNLTAPNTNVIVLSAIGEKPSVKDLIEGIESTEVDTSNYESQLALYNKISAAIEEADLNLQLADEDLYAKFSALENNIKAYEASLFAYGENKIWFELKGNSKLFMDSTSTDFTNMLTITNYLPGLDFGGTVDNPTGVFETDKAAMRGNADKLGCLPYSINKGTTPAKSYYAVADFKSVNGNTYWTINGVDYLINPTKEIIKLVAGPVTTNLESSTTLDAETKADYIKRYSSLTEFTLDVEDGNYTNISFLAALSNTYSRDVNVTFVYEDSTEEKTLTVTGTTINGKTWAEGGIFYHRMKEDSASIWGSDWHDFSPYTISPDSSKVLKEIKLTPVLASGSYRYPIYIISAWGEGKDLDTLISELSAMDVTDAESAMTVKAKLNEIDVALNRINQSLKDADKAIYDAKKAAIDAFEEEISGAEEKVKLEKISYADIPFGSGANSHVFEPYQSTVEGIDDPTSTIYTNGTRDYIYDYMQTYWYDNTVTMGVDSTDSETYTWAHYPIYYRTSTAFAGSSISLDTDSNWTVPFLEADGETVKYLTYNIKTDKKVIKLVGPWNSTYQKLTEKAAEAYNAKNTALRSATVDINDTFKNIYILASKGHYQTASTAPENFTADVYYEGEEVPENVQIGIKKANISTTDADLASVTSIFNKISNNTTNTQSWAYPSLGYASNSTWYSYEIPCDVSKKVDKITFNLTTNNCNVIILSAVGEKPSVKDLINAVESTQVDAYTYKSQLAMYNKITQAISDNDLNLELADEGLYAKYLQLEANIEAFEEIKPTLKPTATMDISYFKGSAPEVEVSIFNPSEVAGKAYKLMFAFYDSQDNYLGAEILDKETTADFNYSLEMKLSKDYSDAAYVKGFMWKDFATMIPFAEAKISPKKDTFKVLSIGNSFSQGVHQYLAEIAKAAGFENIITANLYIGGCSLYTHNENLKNDKAAYEFHIWELKDGKIVKNENVTPSTTMLEGIEYTDWDVITLQQNSANSGNSSTYTYLNDILDYIHANKNENAKVAWHMTWAYQEDSDILATYYPDKTQMDMYDAIVDVVNDKILPNDKIDFIIPAGTAVQNAREELGDIFTSSDGQHLKAIGYYLAGLAWLEKITGVSTENIEYTPNADTANVLDILKTCASNAVSNPYNVTK